MSNKLLWVAFASLIIIVSAVAAVIGIDAKSQPKQAASESANPGLSAQSSLPAPVGDKMEGVLVKDSDLQNLASGLGLPIQIGANSGPLPTLDKVNHEQWAQAVPQAQELLNGLCTCHQRNWLLQFVACGNYALAGDPKFNQAVQDLATVPITE